jgi:hypothetical protein
MVSQCFAYFWSGIVFSFADLIFLVQGYSEFPINSSLHIFSFPFHCDFEEKNIGYEKKWLVY